MRKLCDGNSLQRAPSQAPAPRNRVAGAWRVVRGAKRAAQKTLFRGQIATKSDTRRFRRGKRACEKAREASVSGKKRAKRVKTDGKSGKNREFCRVRKWELV
jgi:hypothetical protein